MSKAVNEPKMKDATQTAPKVPLSKEQKAKNDAERQKRRNANLELKKKAKAEADAAKLPWNDDIPAGQFGQNYAAAYKLATTTKAKEAPKPAAPAKEAPTAEVSPDLPETTTRNGEPPKEMSEAEKLGITPEAVAQRQAENGNTPKYEKTADNPDGLSPGKLKKQKQQAEYKAEKAKRDAANAERAREALAKAELKRAEAAKAAAEAEKRLEVAGTDEQVISDELVKQSEEIDAKKKAAIEAKQATPITVEGDAGNAQADICTAGADDTLPPITDLSEEAADARFKANQAALTEEKPVISYDTENSTDEPATATASEQPAEQTETPTAAPTEPPEAAPITEPVAEEGKDDTPVVTKPAAPVKEAPQQMAAFTAQPVVKGRPGVLDKTKHTTDVIDEAKKFYGSTFTEERADVLTEAYRCLAMAVKAETMSAKGNKGIAMETPVSKTLFEKAVAWEACAFPADVNVAKAA